MEFIFTTEVAQKMTDAIIDFLAGPRWGIGPRDYPDYYKWLSKVHRQLKTEDKRALVALVRGDVVGAIVYQMHRELPNTLELKNITVRPDQRGRHVASFLLRNAEIEGGHDFDVSQVLVDTKVDNYLMRSFLSGNRYEELGEFDIYGKSAGEDVLLFKSLS